MTDQKLDRGKQWLEQVLTLSGIATKVDVQQPAGATAANYWLTIDPSSLTPGQKELIIGSQGATIDALQYLANASLNIGCNTTSCPVSRTRLAASSATALSSIDRR